MYLVVLVVLLIVSCGEIMVVIIQEHKEIDWRQGMV